MYHCDLTAHKQQRFDPTFKHNSDFKEKLYIRSFAPVYLLIDSSSFNKTSKSLWYCIYSPIIYFRIHMLGSNALYISCILLGFCLKYALSFNLEGLF